MRLGAADNRLLSLFSLTPFTRQTCQWRYPQHPQGNVVLSDHAVDFYVCTCHECGRLCCCGAAGGEQARTLNPRPFSRKARRNPDFPC